MTPAVTNTHYPLRVMCNCIELPFFVMYKPKLRPAFPENMAIFYEVHEHEQVRMKLFQAFSSLLSKGTGHCAPWSYQEVEYGQHDKENVFSDL